MRFLFFVLQLALLTFASADIGRLLVVKRYPDTYIVQGRPSTVQIGIYNVGQGPAFNIAVEDVTFFPKQQQQKQQPKIARLMEGSTHPHQLRLDRLQPGTNATLTYQIMPLTPGQYSDRPAKVTYAVKQGGAVQKASSTSQYYVRILTAEEYESNHADHKKTWFMYMLMYLVAIGLPYERYRQSEAASHRMK